MYINIVYMLNNTKIEKIHEVLGFCFFKIQAFFFLVSDCVRFLPVCISMNYVCAELMETSSGHQIPQNYRYHHSGAGNQPLKLWTTEHLSRPFSHFCLFTCLNDRTFALQPCFLDPAILKLRVQLLMPPKCWD